MVALKIGDELLDPGLEHLLAGEVAALRVNSQGMNRTKEMNERSQKTR
jgi:hypothetical protein